MTVTQVYEAHYKDYCSCFEDEIGKYEWAASEIFDLTTYDGSMDELFVKKIIEVLKVILTRTNFDYIEDENNYITYLAVCQLLVRFDWIDWGTSIRGAWVNDSAFQSEKRKPILDSNLEEYGCSEIRFNEAHITALINFIEDNQEATS